MVAVNQTKQKLTLEEFCQLPETKPASEYFKGEIEQKPMPQGEHSVLQIRLATAINEVVLPNKFAGIVFRKQKKEELLINLNFILIG